MDALEAALIKSGSLQQGDLDHFLKSLRGDLPHHPPHAEADGKIASEPLTSVPAPLPVSLPPNASSSAFTTTTDAEKSSGIGIRKAGADEDAVDADEAEGAALTLEHLAFGRSRVEGAHAIPHFGARVPSSIQRHVGNNNYHLARSGIPHSGSGPGNKSPGTGSPITSPETRRKSSLNISVSGIPGGPSSASAAAVAAAGGGSGGRESPSRPPLPGKGSGSGSSLPLPHSHGHGHEHAPVGRTSLSVTAGYAETLTQEERQMRIDALLDLIGPTDVFELFYKKTDVALRAFTKVLPNTERGRLLVKTVSECIRKGSLMEKDEERSYRLRAMMCEGRRLTFTVLGEGRLVAPM